MIIKKLFGFSLALLTGLAGPCFSEEKEFLGHIGKEKYTVHFQVTKNDKENNNVKVVIHFRGGTTEMTYPGYAVGHVVLADLNGDGNEQILFLCYQGGDLFDLGLIGYENGSFRDIDTNGYGGRDFTLVPYGKKFRLGLREKDGKNKGDFDQLLELEGDKWVPVPAKGAGDENPGK